MDENISSDDKNVLLVKEVKDGKLKAVTGMDKKGNIQTGEPTAKNQNSLFAVNTNEAMLAISVRFVPVISELFVPVISVQTVPLFNKMA